MFQIGLHWPGKGEEGERQKEEWGGGREKERLENRPLLKVVAFVQFSCVCESVEG